MLELLQHVLVSIVTFTVVAQKSSVDCSVGRAGDRSSMRVCSVPYSTLPLYRPVRTTVPFLQALDVHGGRFMDSQVLQTPPASSSQAVDTAALENLSSALSLLACHPTASTSNGSGASTAPDGAAGQAGVAAAGAAEHKLHAEQGAPEGEPEASAAATDAAAAPSPDPRLRADVDAAKKAVGAALAGLDMFTTKANLDASKAAAATARANGEIPPHKKVTPRTSSGSSARPPPSRGSSFTEGSTDSRPRLSVDLGTTTGSTASILDPGRRSGRR
jgi:hypothetical protein